MRRWLVLGMAVNALVLLLAIGGSYALSLHIIGQRQQIWCPLLADLTSRPPPAGATAGQRRAYREIVAVRQRLGC